jgi:hypothetical protein
MRVRTFFGGWSRRRPSRVGSLAVVCLALVAAMLAAPSASAAVNTYLELEGNVLDEGVAASAPDWGASSGTNSIFTVTNGVGDPRTTLPTNFFDAGFARDFIPGSTSDTSAYAGSGKDINNITSWSCKTEANTTDKGDIQNAYAAVATDPTNGNLLLYFGMEKNAPNGNNNMGVWFLQDGSVGCDGTGAGGNGKPFSGTHTDGDILLVAAFTNGGSTPTITAFKWVGGANGALSSGLVTGGACGTTGSANLCAITNDTTNVTTPWQTTNKNSQTPQNKTGQGTLLNPDQFYEGAIDLTANRLDVDSEGNPVCVNRFLFNTRSSQEPTATLYDFAAGDVQTCFSPSITTLLKEDKGATGPSAEDVSLPADGDHTVTLPTNVYDTSTVTGGVSDPTGTVTYSLWTDSSCTVASTNPTFSGGGNTATVTVGQPSPTLTFAAADEYWWQATYNPSASSRNNPATSVCTSEPLVVEKVSPSIATTPSATSIVIGDNHSFNDVATISGGYFPSGGIAPGNVEFKLYGPFTSAPGAADCTAGKLIASASTTVAATRSSDTAATATSASYTPTAVGLYQWTAKYLGNAQNNATAESACGDTTEQVTVQPVAPSIATKIALSDRAKVTGVTGAGAVAGSVVFTLHPSLDCTGAAVYNSGAVNLNASGEATTPDVTYVNAGSYSWKVVFTPAAGSNYTGQSTSCTTTADETAVIGYRAPSPIS